MVPKSESEPLRPYGHCSLKAKEAFLTRCWNPLGDAERRACVPTQERGNEMKRDERDERDEIDYDQSEIGICVLVVLSLIVFDTLWRL